MGTARRRRRFHAVPVRFIIPNLVTLLALCMGLTAIRFAVEGMFDIAVLAVVAAAVLDGLDGRLARALRGTSRFGAELDSLADFVDFGVAPALILYLWSLQGIKSLGWFAALVFAMACALRLARFNVMSDDPDRPPWQVNFFTGMPAPAGAIVALLPLYLHLSIVALPNNRVLVPFEIGYVLFIAFLMASRIPHFSGKKIGRVPREYVIFVLAGVAMLALLLVIFPMEIMVALTLTYLATIPLAMRRFKSFEARDAAARALIETSDSKVVRMENPSLQG
ncbi:CDP-alcohol phosphatidyltransferase family protein [Beijerinckia indica]|uniref:CDP-diacylglycerol--serine O-phosphatidyltransferase n=1 Tax=Beijerinckia indica subsp. indica (strain ATCC 9039 / DSM 1715 / NCIMB 8712) TaxID=395963 RepID=B2IC54_BEII9|nr:phosphatidylcholine/phosphatidylserine synthase [Beijerinckia indica]ACB95309.1 CDP-diacylglycerol--serine O-phosphatidyltransferase [Beijerinckia indica subsp. indica ATCC 9039]